MRPILILLLALTFLPGCSGRHADRQVQICLYDDAGISKFRLILVAVSQRQKLKFFDQSSRVEHELGELKSDLVGRFPIHDYHVHDKSEGVEISATNLGLGPYETTLSYDLRNERQKAVAADLTGSLEREFQIIPTPDNQGAAPLANCPHSAKRLKDEG